MRGAHRGRRGALLGRVTPGSSVLVVGAGGVGQFVVQGARIAGAETIVAIDPEPPAATRHWHSARPTRPLRTGSRACSAGAAPEGVDFAFDAVGDPDTTAFAMRFAGSGSTTVIVGLPAAGRRLDLDPVDLIRKEKWLTGCLYGSEDPAVALPVLLDHVRAGRLVLEQLLGTMLSARRRRRRRCREPARSGRPRHASPLSLPASARSRRSPEESASTTSS